jgi:DNA-binding beta-propeller fold protein YncE
VRCRTTSSPIPEGLYFYCTNESEATLDVFDTRTLRLVEQLPLTASPNKGALNKKHRKIYVGIAAAPYVDVFDLDTHEKITSVEVATGIHNVYVSPDGNWVVAGLNARDEGSIEIIDPTVDRVVDEITLRDERGRAPHGAAHGVPGGGRRLDGQAPRRMGRA